MNWSGQVQIVIFYHNESQFGPDQFILVVTISFWSCPNHDGQVQINLVRPKSFWTNQNCFGHIGQGITLTKLHKLNVFETRKEQSRRKHQWKKQDTMEWTEISLKHAGKTSTIDSSFFIVTLENALLVQGFPGQCCFLVPSKPHYLENRTDLVLKLRFGIFQIL